MLTYHGQAHHFPKDVTFHASKSIQCHFCLT